MDRVRVSSSDLRSVGYEGTTLEVEFRDGSVYQYFDVPAARHASLMAASSKGGYFADHIKGVYRYRRTR
jgi:hypothetical protein